MQMTLDCYGLVGGRMWKPGNEVVCSDKLEVNGLCGRLIECSRLELQVGYTLDSSTALS